MHKKRTNQITKAGLKGNIQLQNSRITSLEKELEGARRLQDMSFQFGKQLVGYITNILAIDDIEEIRKLRMLGHVELYRALANSDELDNSIPIDLKRCGICVNKNKLCFNCCVKNPTLSVYSNFVAEDNKDPFGLLNVFTSTLPLFGTINHPEEKPDVDNETYRKEFELYSIAFNNNHTTFTIDELCMYTIINTSLYISEDEVRAIVKKWVKAGWLNESLDQYSIIHV